MTNEHSLQVSSPASAGTSSRRRRRRGAAVAVVALMMVGGLLSFVPGQAGAQGHFSDTANHWAHDGINFLMDAEVLGDSLSTWCGPSEFCPERPTQRWMAAVWLVKALLAGQESDPVTRTSFNDISPNDFWAPHVEYLAQLGLTVGYPDGSFRPYAPVTRKQMNVFMQRGLNVERLAGNAEALRNGAFAMLHTCNDGGVICPYEQVSRGESANMLAAGLQGGLNQKPTDAPEGIFWDIHEGISAGDYHTCALHHSGPKDDEVSCWGLNSHGQLNNPNPPTWKYKAVAAGGAHTCVLRRDNQIDCWGLNNHGQTDVPEGRYKAVEAGATNTCAIRTNHHLVCWGKSDNGINDDTPPHAMDNLDVGASHACSIRRGALHDSNRKRLYCWGDDSHGQVSNIPQHRSAGLDSNLLQKGRQYFGVAAGNEFTCAAIYDSGHRNVQTSHGWESARIEVQYRQCWGLDDTGQAPYREEPEEFPQSVGGEVQIKEHMIEVGWWHGCAIAYHWDGVFCWGNDARGQHDHGEGAAYKAIAAGGVHSCGVTFDRGIECWGFRF